MNHTLNYAAALRPDSCESWDSFSGSWFVQLVFYILWLQQWLFFLH